MAPPRPSARPATASAVQPAARLWIYHRPDNKPLQLDKLAKKLGPIEPALMSETEAEGLTLLTNDGEVARLLALPSSGWVRRYFLLSAAKLSPALITAWAAGPTVGGLPYGPVDVRVAEPSGKAQWYAVTLREGRGRSLAALCRDAGVTCKRLACVSLGPFQLGEIAPGDIEELPAATWQAQLGGKFKGT